MTSSFDTSALKPAAEKSAQAGAVSTSVSTDPALHEALVLHKALVARDPQALAAAPVQDKVITFGIPCYNSADYMDRCITSLLEGSNYATDMHICIVDDGSTKDATSQKADEWAARYPDIISVVHQPNGGHGMAVLAALSHARGKYFKIVDSDDWLQAHALQALLSKLREFIANDEAVDLVITNYVFEHVLDGKQNVVDFRYALPRERIICWDQIGHFMMTQNLLMHSLCYRTDVLLDGGLPMPAHTFYVDNIYAYVPLPRCKRSYYLDVDLYRYFIGREDQSINESVAISRIDQQLVVTRIMMHAYHLNDDIACVKLRNYMCNHFTLMMAVCSVYSRMSDKPDAMANLQALWDELKAYDEYMYKRARRGAFGVATNLPTKAGVKTTIYIYRIAQKLYKFN